MNRFLITGFSGFVGRNFTGYINDNTSNSSILGIDITEPAFKQDKFGNVKIRFEKTDLRDKDRICKLIYDFRPDYLLHLASYSSVSGSWTNPNNSFQNNVNIFLSLLEDLRMTGADCRIIYAGSSDVYGEVKFSDLPVKEEQVLKPLSPFGIAKFSQELLARLYCDVYGMDIITTRSFNHIGPGQSYSSCVSSFAKQLVDIKRSNGNEFLVTGDVSVVRDFIDVRDVVRAYHKLFLKGKKGEIYNVCSGFGISLHNIIHILCEMLEIRFSIKEDKKLRRPADIPVIVGCNDKIKKHTNWSNEILLEDSLKEIIDDHFFKEDSAKSYIYS